MSSATPDRTNLQFPFHTKHHVYNSFQASWIKPQPEAFPSTAYSYTIPKQNCFQIKMQKEQWFSKFPVGVQIELSMIANVFNKQDILLLSPKRICCVENVRHESLELYKRRYWGSLFSERFSLTKNNGTNQSESELPLLATFAGDDSEHSLEINFNDVLGHM